MGMVHLNNKHYGFSNHADWRYYWEQFRIDVRTIEVPYLQFQFVTFDIHLNCRLVIFR